MRVMPRIRRQALRSVNLRYFKFRPVDNIVEWYTYSPVLGEWETDYYSQGAFTLAQNPSSNETPPQKR